MLSAANNVKKTPANRKRIAVASSTVRSAIANGSRLLEGLDGRSAAARRYRDVQDDIARDLGGFDRLTETQRHLIRSASGLVLLREALDVKVLNGENVSAAEYCRISNSLRRVLATIGFTRSQRDVTPSLRQYIDSEAQ